MIRPTTVLCLLTACGSGLYLYSEKHRTALLDRDIGRVIHATEAAQARTGLLRAEWALLNEPGRLQDMAGRYLTLHPMAPTQFVPVAQLAAHLPAPVATPPDGDAADDDAAPAADLAVASALPPATLPDLPAIHPMQPPKADVKADARTGAKMLASASPRPHAQHHITLADRDDMPEHEGLLTHGTPLPLAAPQPIGARVFSAMARPMRMQAARPAIVSALPSYAPAHASVQSALGGGAALPPPIPYGR